MHDGTRLRVEQGLMRVEARAALLGVARAVETPVVVYAGRQSFNINVPTIERSVECGIEADHLKRRGAPRLFVQQQLGTRRFLIPDGKIDAGSIHRHAERIPPPWP